MVKQSFSSSLFLNTQYFFKMTDAFLHTAQTAARKAAIILMDNFGKVRKNDIRKKSKTDFLSFVDEQSEKSIIEAVAAIWKMNISG